MKLLARYKNGNVSVTRWDDGTTVRRTEDDEFRPAFAENVDCKITDRCDGGCQFCYEGCTPLGKHGDIMNDKFIDSLHPYTEMALNGNDLSHPHLLLFLSRLKEKKVIANLTVNQIHFERHYNFIKELLDKKLIWGLGISLREPTDVFINLVKTIPNAVIHTINGILTENDLDRLANHDLKILILGYKTTGRGLEYRSKNMKRIEHNMKWLRINLIDYMSKFKAVSFDNLSISQLQINPISIKYLLNPSLEKWKDILGYEGRYQVSNFGRIKSLEKRHKKYTSEREKILMPTNINKKTLSYQSVDLCINGKHKRCLVHRLVAETFIKNDDLTLTQVNHKDENPLNNYVENLEWCNNQYNLNYGNHNLKMKQTLIKKVVQKSLDGRIIKVYNNVFDVAKEFGCCPETVRNLCKNVIHKYYHNRIKKMLNYKWEYLDTKSSTYVSSTNKNPNDKIYNHSEEWERFYMGDDGTFTFYIDLVNQTFSKNSVIAKVKSIPINGMTIDEMFEVVRTTNWED